MSYYLQEYQVGHICVEPLAMALFELFNTQAKVKSLLQTFSTLCLFPLTISSHLIFYLFHHHLHHHQLSMLSDVRSLVAPQDLELYDRLVLHREREAHQAWQGGLGGLHLPGHCNHAASVMQTAGSTLLPMVSVFLQYQKICLLLYLWSLLIFVFLFFVAG